MPAPNDRYAAQVNPPRRAKALAYSHSGSSTDERAHEQPPQVHLNPLMTTLPTSVPDSQETQQRQAPSVGPKKRGRKPGSGAFPAPTRAAREAARRESHSRIEKARRGKINDALDALRAMVPPDGQLTSRSGILDNIDEVEVVSENEIDDREALRSRIPKADGSKPKQAEFKLDILERTVIFMRALLERVEHLESAASPSSVHPQTASTSESIPRRRNKAEGPGMLSTDVNERASKRRRVEDSPLEKDLENVVEEEEDSGNEEEDELGTTTSSPIAGGTPRFSLPSIRSLLEVSANTLPPANGHAYLPSPSLSPLVYPSGSGSVSPTFRSGSRSSANEHNEAYLPSPPFSIKSSATTTRTSTSTSPTFSVVSSHNHGHAAYAHSPLLHLPAPALSNATSKDKRRASQSTSRDSSSPYLEAESEHDHEQTMALTLLQMRSRRTSVPEVKATPSSILGIHHSQRAASESQ